MKKIVLASNNEHKVKEFKEILSNYEVLSLKEIEYSSDIEETGQTFEENALIKAKTISKYLQNKGLNYIVIADDSGLCVPSLNNAPGVYSARYAGNHDDAANRKLLQENLIDKDRKAYFVCDIVVYYPDNNYKVFEGKTFGTITTEELGRKDFGYDCIFKSDDLNKTFGEATEEEKNSVSHRGRAIEKMLPELNKQDNNDNLDDIYGYKDKICVVTGATSGMGEATTKMLVNLKAKVYALDVNECHVPGITKYLKCNLADKTSIDEAFREIPEHIDSFFGIAGLSGSKTDYITTFNCNYTSNMYITLNYLKERMTNGGGIVFVTSTAGLNWKQFKKEQDKIVESRSFDEVTELIKPLAKIAPATFAYMYSKRCLSQFACIQAIELGKKGIRVNNVMPGSTDTGMKDEFEKMAGGKEALLAETGVAHRLATSQEMAGPIVFLNSKLASFISGVDLPVDSADACMKTLKIKKDREAVSCTNKFILKIAKKMMAKK